MIVTVIVIVTVISIIIRYHRRHHHLARCSTSLSSSFFPSLWPYRPHDPEGKRPGEVTCETKPTVCKQLRGLGFVGTAYLMHTLIDLDGNDKEFEDVPIDVNLSAAAVTQDTTAPNQILSLRVVPK